MRPQSFCADQIKKTLKALKIATLEELVCALGQPSVRTVFRKLKELEYLYSYSHRGQYYTLQAVVRFDEDGLWEHRSVWFSRFGTLLNSVRSFVDRSTQGYTASELDGVLHVETSHALLQCVRENHLIREALGRGYLYLSASSSRAQAQRKARKRAERQAAIELIVENPGLAVDEAKAVVLLFLSLLDESQRRLYAGLESLKLGHGGDHYIADLFGMDPHTVARGRRELMEPEGHSPRVRKSGAGRPQTKKNA